MAFQRLTPLLKTVLLIAICLPNDFISAKTSNNLFGIPRFWKRRDEYTPLLFFTVTQKGEFPNCDKMEKLVSEIENELSVKVHRVDIRKNRLHHKLYQKIDTLHEPAKGIIPLLYHRESRQIVAGAAHKSVLRRWAKGMWLERPEDVIDVDGGYEPSVDDMFAEEEEEMDVIDLEERGKEAMERRREEGAKEKK
eukprot:CAMPEP_0172497006 /NCGR_PEP_ID=MMETSP1066-20121228/94745_1 /TAXON_ID=671091 /ORGANISM="Coscinodiscus wailesii, Strain CCMP2513" /LENGTH=193 /DNA_ID=CAMNT_0013269579 /DNA_START=37 /DNA_END=618 /DNA_ORIENTATION=-